MHKSYINQDLHISLQKSNQLKSIAILMMLFLHLFNREEHDLFSSLIVVMCLESSYLVNFINQKINKWVLTS